MTSTYDQAERGTPTGRRITLALAITAAVLSCGPMASLMAQEPPARERDARPDRGERPSGAEPSTRPTVRVPFMRGGGGLERFREREGNQGGDRVPGTAPFYSQDEGREFFRFVEDRMPNVSTALAEARAMRQGNPQGGNEGRSGATWERQRWLIQTALFQYRRYTRGTKDFPELEEQYLKDVRDTDDMVGLLVEVRGADDARREEIRGEVRKRLESLAVSIVAERRRRIEKLREMLAREERALSVDEPRLQQGIDSRLEEMFSKLAPAGEGRNEGRGEGRGQNRGEGTRTPATRPSAK